MSGRLEGKVAWLSGASSGIGEATAKLLASEGAKVVLAGIDAGGGRRVASEIAAAGGTAIDVACDVASEAAVKASIERAVTAFGGLHVLVNNAAIIQVRPLHEETEERWDRLMAVNVKSIFFSVKHAIPHLRRSPRSHIVNVGSVSSFVGQAGTPAYTASKGAVLLLTRSIALDYAADGVRANCVCPGITDTPMLRAHLATVPDPEAALAKRLRRVPLGAALRPEEVARAVLYLATEESAGVTGTSLVVDGGYTAAAEWE
jgi:NAD(P)-dependent dehydrogenase (short-subunit alcohol dehydrogenase family)